MIDPMGVLLGWFCFGVAVLVVVIAWRSELFDMIKQNTPGYGVTRVGAMVFICAMLSLLWPVVLFAAVRRAMRGVRKGKE